jgi:DNA-binding transcriptional MerR regulator
LAEYRLDELARVSEVSARNIRAYRERGLLDPPRRVGRSAYYDDYHLSQLRTIKELLRRGFTSSHIAEFLTSMRQGADLADILGIQRAVLGTPAKESSGADGVEEQTPQAQRRAIDIDPDSDEARRLTEYGLTEVIDGTVVPVDSRIGEIIVQSSDQMPYVRAALEVHEATGQVIESLAAELVRVLGDRVVCTDYRELWISVVCHGLDHAVRERVSPASDPTV